MKKLILIAIVAIFSTSNIIAQDVDFGATAGFLNARAKVSSGGSSATASDSGFYVGGFADFNVSEKFNIQPELLYGKIGEGDGIIVPIMAKYYASEKLNIQAGPYFDIATESVPDDFTGFGISLGAGLGYDIDDNFSLVARYTFQLNDYYTGDLDFDTTSNSLQVGLGYKF